MHGAICRAVEYRAERNDYRVLGKGTDRRADQKIYVPFRGRNGELSEGIFVAEKKTRVSSSSYR